MTTIHQCRTRVHQVTVMCVGQGGLGDRLSAFGDIAVVRETGGDVVQLVALHRPDVLVFDPQRPSGIGLIGAVRSASPGTAILVVTVLDDDATIRSALQAGARGYLVRGADETGMTDIIRSVAAGEMIFGASIATRIATLLAPVQPIDRLTSREREIHDLMCAGLSNGAIAQRLHLAPKTVRNHVSAIGGKIDRVVVPDRPAAETRRIAFSGHYPRPKPTVW
jgi:DNA-binding NarL/FixJ family response regulator